MKSVAAGPSESGRGELPATASYVALYVEGFGRCNGFIARTTSDQFGLKFTLSEEQRRGLIGQLVQFVENGLTLETRLRRYERTTGDALSNFMRANGQLVKCCILDVSLQGMSLKTLHLPPDGEIVSVGEAHGRVVRHHDQGIGIHFVKVVPVTSSVGTTTKCSERTQSP